MTPPGELDMCQVNEALASNEPWGTIIALALGYFGPKLAAWLKAKFPPKPTA